MAETVSVLAQWLALTAGLQCFLSSCIKPWASCHTDYRPTVLSQVDFQLSLLSVKRSTCEPHTVYTGRSQIKGKIEQNRNCLSEVLGHHKPPEQLQYVLEQVQQVSGTVLERCTPFFQSLCFDDGSGKSCLTCQSKISTRCYHNHCNQIQGP